MEYKDRYFDKMSQYYYMCTKLKASEGENNFYLTVLKKGDIDDNDFALEKDCINISCGVNMETYMDDKYNIPFDEFHKWLDELRTCAEKLMEEGEK